MGGIHGAGTLADAAPCSWRMGNPQRARNASIAVAEVAPRVRLTPALAGAGARRATSIGGYFTSFTPVIASKFL